MFKGACFFAVLLGVTSCKSVNKSTGSLETAAASSSTEQLGQGCRFAQEIWNDINGSKYGTSVEAMPPLKGEYATAISIFKDPTIAMKTFIPEQNARGSEEIPRDANGHPKRPKAIHAYGTVARIKFVVDPSVQTPYTGLFQSGAPCGLIRMSLGVKPKPEGIIPGAALKFYVDNNSNGAFVQPQSQNIVVMNQVDFVPGYNIFELPFSNILPPPVAAGQIAGGLYFKGALAKLGAKDTRPEHLTVEHLAEYTADGKVIAKERAPYRITLVPTKTATALMANSKINADFRVELTRFPVGGVLYEVYVDDTTIYHAEPYGAHIGQIVATSDFVASTYGDEILHFAHHTQLK